jgi:long-chain fatty acid transport protein
MNGARSTSLAAFLIIAATTAADASPAEMFGFGARSPGMAGAGVATTADSESVYLNPAGLADVDGRHVHFTSLVGDFDLDGVDRPVDQAFGVGTGLTMNLPLRGSWRDRIGIAITGYFPSDVVTRVRTPPAGVPFYALLENRTQTIGVHAGIGARVLPRLNVGVGVVALGALRGNIDVITDTAGRIAAVSRVGLGSHIAPLVGAQWRAGRSLDLGLVWRAASVSEFDIDVKSHLGDEIPVPLPEIQLAGIAQYDPMVLTAEAAWYARPMLTVTGGLAWQRWSAFPTPSENPVTAGMAVPSPGFSDTVVPRIAVEWKRYAAANHTFTARAGYAFRMSPAPDTDAEHSLVDNHRHVVSAGAGYLIPTGDIPMRVDAWVQFHHLVSRTNELPDTTIESAGRIVAGGITLGFDIR